VLVSLDVYRRGTRSNSSLQHDRDQEKGTKGMIHFASKVLQGGIAVFYRVV
jgi:hypothetical protein